MNLPMKNSSVWVALPISAAIMIATLTAMAGDGDQFYDGELKFTAAGVSKEFDSAEAACQAGAKDLQDHGNHQQYVKTKNGTTDDAMTCVLKDLDAKDKHVWDQVNSVTKFVKCQDGSHGISTDNSGKFSTVKCRCDATKGCPTKPPAAGSAAPPPPKKKSCPVTPVPEVCKSKKRGEKPSFSDLDRTTRCTQQPAPAKRVPNTVIAAQSDKNQQDVRRNTPELVKRYNQALREVTKDLREDKEMGTGRDQAGKQMFPKFTRKDMCATGGPTDVNIGMLCGTREADFAAANNLVGLAETPELKDTEFDCVWHHHEELGRMQLIKRSSHDAKQHTGGVAVWKKALGTDYPLCCP